MHWGTINLTIALPMAIHQHRTISLQSDASDHSFSDILFLFTWKLAGKVKMDLCLMELSSPLACLPERHCFHCFDNDSVIVWTSTKPICSWCNMFQRSQSVTADPGQEVVNPRSWHLSGSKWRRVCCGWCWRSPFLYKWRTEYRLAFQGLFRNFTIFSSPCFLWNHGWSTSWLGKAEIIT